MKKLFLLITLLISCSFAIAQSDSAAMAKMVKESGIDPTKVQSRASYSFLISDPPGSNIGIINRVTFNLGVNRWSFTGKYEINTLHKNNTESVFSTGSGDLRVNVLNAFFVKGKNALAGSAEITLPIGKQGYGIQYLALMPALTYSYSFTPSLIFAIQPQYLFSLVKGEGYPKLSVLTVRAFIAKFTKSGYFFVFEPRPIYDFTNDDFKLIISPIIGRAIGKGFNIVFLAELPASKEFWNKTGPVYQFGLSKSF
jgi:hypothetical protein